MARNPELRWDEVKDVREHHDPINNLKDVILAAGHADEAKLKEIEKDVREIVNDAADFAQASPLPDPAELYTDVLA